MGKKIRRQLFIWISFVAAILGIIGFVISNYQVISTINPAILYSLLIAGVVYIFLSRIYIFVKNKEMEPFKRHILITHRLNHLISHLARDTILDIHELEERMHNEVFESNTLIKVDDAQKIYKAKSRDILNKCCPKVANMVGKIIQEYVDVWHKNNEVFRTVVKIVDPKSNSGNDRLNWYYNNFAWDSETTGHINELPENEKRIFHNTHQIKDNSAIQEITLKSIPCFFCNDLKNLSNQEGVKYKNPNGKWKEVYNAKMIVPIRVLGKFNTEYYQLFGFLSVDCQNKNNSKIFEGDKNSATFNIVSQAADTLAVIFHNIEEMVRKLDSAVKQQQGYLHRMEEIRRFNHQRKADLIRRDTDSKASSVDMAL